jgi:hypothetical protein
MKNMALSGILTFLFLAACTTLMGRWSASKIDTMSDRCIAENEELKPAMAKKFHNLSTQERTKKKKELEDYRKKRIEIYQSLYNFKTIYLTHTDNDGTCRKNECKPLEKLRSLIAAGCPETGESFPTFNTDKQ